MSGVISGQALAGGCDGRLRSVRSGVGGGIRLALWRGVRTVWVMSVRAESEFPFGRSVRRGGRGIGLLFAVALGLFGSLSAVARAAVPSSVRPSTWVANGQVDSVLPAGKLVYIGGYFNYVGPNTGGGVPLSLKRGSAVARFPKVNGSVLAVVPDGKGGYYIGGSFDKVGGVARANLAQVQANGSVDPTWNPHANSTVRALAVSGSTVYAGGQFSSIGGRARNLIAALGVRTGRATAWNPNARGPAGYSGVYALAVSGSTVYVGGEIFAIGGRARRYIAALSAGTGRATSWNPGANGVVYALAVSRSIVYAGGEFSSIGGQRRDNLAALNTRSGGASAWNPNATNEVGAATVDALAVTGSTVYAGGYFSSIGGEARNAIAALDASTGRATAWNPNASAGADAEFGADVYALAVTGSTVYAGGNFSSIGGVVRNNIAALDASTGRASAWNPSAGWDVVALAVSRSTVYAGGNFSSIGGVVRNNIAALDASTGRATAWNPNANAAVSTLARSGSTVYAGGYFTSIGGQARDQIAALDAQTGNATAWDANANPPSSCFEKCAREFGVLALAVSGSTVYAGGYFTSIGGQPRNQIAALDASTGDATAWNPSAGGPETYGVSRDVDAFALSGSTVYAGGQFTSIGGQPRNNLAALDADTGSASAWNPNASDGVNALAVSGSTVYAGGQFGSIGGRARNLIAALDPRTGRATAWNPNASGPDSYSGVYALALSGSSVYAGGYFGSIGGRARNNLAALNPRSGRASAWNPNADDVVDALAVTGSTVYAGGRFTMIGGFDQGGFAAFAPLARPTNEAR